MQEAPDKRTYPRDISRWVQERLTYDEKCLLAQAVNETLDNGQYADPDNLYLYTGLAVEHAMCWLDDSREEMSDEGLQVFGKLCAKWLDCLWWWEEIGDKTQGVSA